MDQEQKISIVENLFHNTQPLLFASPVPQGGRGSREMMPEQVMLHYCKRDATVAGAKTRIVVALEERYGNLI